nr:hypothetical protein [uncultured Lachnoanaerobaculum sp.]
MNREKLYNRWIEFYNNAKKNTLDAKSGNGILIEVAAQHPLIDGFKPNEEFEKRLLLGIQIFYQMIEKGNKVYIYVPGSIHMDNGVIDCISLSEAGRKFLVEKGIPDEYIYADDMNIKYKGEDGVYNSTDECYVASMIFRDMSLGELHCVCSSGQMMRKVLSYIRFGYVPYMHTVSCDNMYHNYIDEIFRNIPILLEDKDALQANSEEAERLRKMRKPE